MHFEEMSIADMECRKKEIAEMLDKEDADLNALGEEVRNINAELEKRKAEAEKKEEIRKSIAAGAGKVISEVKMENTKRTLDEVRNSKEYIDAFARYLKNEDDRECRALLSELAPANGQVPVPVFVETRIREAWENDQILSRVTRTNFRGVLRVPFELSADPAYWHAEGAGAITEEDLTLGIVELRPRMIKKYITVSDELIALMDRGGEELIRYIYDELTYQITKLLADSVVEAIASASTTSGTSAIGVPQITGSPAINTIPTAAANLSAGAENLVVIMNRLTEVNFLAAYASGNFAIDPFAGLTKIYTNALPAYDTASATDVYAIVGDLRGVQVNYPEGDGVVLKYDDLTLAEADLVKLTGRQYAAYGLTMPGRFVNIVKPSL